MMEAVSGCLPNGSSSLVMLPWQRSRNGMALIESALLTHSVPCSNILSGSISLIVTDVCAGHGPLVGTSSLASL